MILKGKDAKLINLGLMLRKNHVTRAKYLKKKNVFKHMGEGCWYQPRYIPTEACLVSMGDNVIIAAGVKMITHDVSARMIRLNNNYDDTDDFKYFMGTIEIGDNVLVNADAMIMPNVKIGSNVIVAAGSVVAKDVPDGSIVGGNPAKVIGTLDDFVEKRRKIMKTMPKKTDGIEKVMEYFWGE